MPQLLFKSLRPVTLLGLGIRYRWVQERRIGILAARDDRPAHSRTIAGAGRAGRATSSTAEASASTGSPTASAACLSQTGWERPTHDTGGRQ
jgi:hypothetical protein